MGRDRSRSRERRSRDRRGGERDRSRDRDRGDKSSRKEKASPREERKKSPEKPDDDTFRPGRTVITHGLQKNPEKNGSIGVLVEFNKEKGRWVVEFSSGNNNFKEDNLELMPDNSDVIDDKEEPPTAKIYITKLSADTTEKDIQDLFSGCGVIAKEKPKSSRDRGFEDQWPFAVKLYKPGKADGDGCITFQDPHAAKAAIKTYNRYKFKGSRIGVAYAGQGIKYENVELQKPWYLREENMGKMDREGGGGGGGAAGAGMKPGDWTCECGASVFASKDQCFKCGAPKPGGSTRGGDDGGGGGKDGGGKDGGGKGGKPGDWTCPGCGASVFASKDSCYKCGESKPGGGGGGGKGKGKGKW